MKIKPQEFYTTNRFQDGSDFKFVEFDSDVPKAILDGGSYPFGLRMPVQKGWSKASHRLLVVIQHVDGADLKSKELASANAGVALTNVIRYTRDWYRDLTDETIDFKVGVVNFNYAKTYHLDSKDYETMSQLNGARVREAIEWLDPTHVFIVGDEAASYTLDKPYEKIITQRGWVHTINDRKYAHTIDINRCYSTSSYTEDDDEGDDEVSDYGGGNKDRKLVATANLLGFVCRNLLSLYFGKLPFHISKIVPDVRVVDTIERFDKMMGLINDATAVAFDSETKNLTVLNNKLLVFQFAVDTKKGYVLPVDHPDAPWTDKERKYIKRQLREFFRQPIDMPMDETQRYIIGHGLKFDLRVVRHGLGIPVISWPIWDTMAGSFCLEENLGALKTFGVPYGNLAQLCCYLGNDFYHTKEGFNKENREDIENQDFYDPTFLSYCAFDVQGPFGIHLQQQKEADTQRMCAEDSYGDHYRRFMLLQMSNIIHDFSHMEQVGVHVDLPYLLGLMQKDSIINQRIKEFEAEFYALPSVKKANKLICDREKAQSNTLFGKVEPWSFKFGTVKHLHCLFFEVMELEPITYGEPDRKTGEPVPSLGKEFQLAYKKEYKEVELLERISKLKHLKSSFIEAWYKKVTESEDGRQDSALHPGFGFFDVVSGRSNSFNPSLQQTPSRTAEAKFIKRMFIAAFKKFIMKLDFSAHEVRCWSYAGQDFKLGGLFKIGRQMRMDYMRTADPALPSKIKLEGDLHRVNVARFFKVDLKTIAPEELEKKRDSVKAIVFGAIYGRSVRSIAKATGMPVKDTQKSYDMFFKEYHVAGDWLKWASDTGRTYLHTHSFIGRKRNLWGFLTGVNQIMAANERQAMNSPIQGVAADLAHTANRIFTLQWQKVCMKFGWMDEDSISLPNYIDVMVHDSSRSEVDWDKFMACVQVANWAYTTGTEEYYERHFGVKFTCPLEIEFEFGPDESHLKKWDWSWPGLQKILREGLEVMKAEIHPDVDVDEAFQIMYEDWEHSKVRKFLDAKYPWWGGSEYNEGHGLKLYG